ncbi:MAG: hypothetical protein WBX25_27005 [Rhodomicrobium sp.]
MGRLRAGQRPPLPLGPVEQVLDTYAAEMGAIRKEGLTHGLPTEVVERIFALGFALEQLRQNLRDLERWTREYADAKKTV